MKARLGIRILLVLSGMALFAAVAAAQTDFSGTWLLDKEKSDLGQLGRGRGARAGRAAGGNFDMSSAGQKLVITQSTEEIVVQRSLIVGQQELPGQRQAYRLDGSEITIPAMAGRGEIKGKAEWNGNALEIKGTQKLSTQRGEFDVNYEERWTLSDDGKVLTITTTRTTGAGAGYTTRMVYNRQ